jgi:hypothetical protein
MVRAECGTGSLSLFDHVTLPFFHFSGKKRLADLRRPRSPAHRAVKPQQLANDHQQLANDHQNGRSVGQPTRRCADGIPVRWIELTADHASAMLDAMSALADTQ